jgi:phospholipid/cholesterol/gamma-HCH transport system substrate-binding protein
MQGRSLAEIATGAVVLVIAALFLGYAVLHSGRAGGAPDGLVLTARFDRIDGLANGADVRIAGVKVGSVTGQRIDPQSFAAEVTMDVDQNLRLPADTSAEITSEGLLGGKYVSLVPGGSDQVLRNGGRITETQGSVSLESLLGRFIFSVTQMNADQTQNQSRNQPAPPNPPSNLPPTGRAPR